MNEIIEKAVQEIKNRLGKSNFWKDLPFQVSSVAEDYTKRVMESKYDNLAKTRLFQSLKSLEEKQRFMVEFAFYVLNSFIKRHVPESTPAMAFAKGIITDFFPEMGKRLINGDTPEGKEVIELVPQTDSGGNSHYAPKDKPAGKPPKVKAKKESDFFRGALTPLKKRLRERIEKHNQERGSKS